LTSINKLPLLGGDWDRVEVKEKLVQPHENSFCFLDDSVFLITVKNSE
jgi:hypothetical protein